MKFRISLEENHQYDVLLKLAAAACTKIIRLISRRESPGLHFFFTDAWGFIDDPFFGQLPPRTWRRIKELKIENAKLLKR